MTQEEILRRAGNLSSFDGQLLNAIGDNDDLLEFRGKGSNLANQKNDQFTMILVNANAATRDVRLFTPISKEYASLYPGQAVTGAFTDINGDAGLTGSSAKAALKIEMFLYYVSHNPTRLTNLRIKSTVSTQIDFELTLDEVNPYRNVQNESFQPSNEIGQDSNQTSIVIFPVKAQLDYLSDLITSVAGSSTATITFFMGTEVNLAKSLKKKYGKASAVQGAMGARIAELNANKGLVQLS